VNVKSNLQYCSINTEVNMEIDDQEWFPVLLRLLQRDHLHTKLFSHQLQKKWPLLKIWSRYTFWSLF